MRGVAVLLLPALSMAETLMEREYPAGNAGLDDGYGYDGWDQESTLPSDAPGFAQGYLLTDAATKTDAKCLDGTPAIYYHAKGFGSGANKWFVHQQGGGWCYSLEDCLGRSKGSLGSTAKDPKTRTLNGGYMSWDNVSNPLMWNWNKVELRYCDGASVSGDKVGTTTVGGKPLNFRGRAILDAEIDSILNVNGMKSATDVIVSGCSAGGLATFLHCDYWADAISKATTLETGAGAKVACMPVSDPSHPQLRCLTTGLKICRTLVFSWTSSVALSTTPRCRMYTIFSSLRPRASTPPVLKRTRATPVV
jgi:hypothetical protein